MLCFPIETCPKNHTVLIIPLYTKYIIFQVVAVYRPNSVDPIGFQASEGTTATVTVTKTYKQSALPSSATVP